MFGDLLGDILGGVFSPSGRTDRRLKRIVEQGTTGTARIDAIRVVNKSDSATEWYYGLLLPDGTRAGVRQMLVPDHHGIARLGARVVTRELDGQVVVDWPATLEQAGVPDAGAAIVGTPRKSAPEPGIHDDSYNLKLLERGRRTTAVIVEAEPVEVMGVRTQNMHLHLAVQDAQPARRVSLKRALIPPYGKHLVQPGQELPVAVHESKPDKLEIDWAAACSSDARGE